LLAGIKHVFQRQIVMLQKYKKVRATSGPLTRLNNIREFFVILLFLLFFQVIFECCFAAEKREFPVWNEGVYAEINRRLGEKAAARIIDIIQFIKVHLNDPVEIQLEVVNDYMNEMDWIADRDLWKQEDYWATPFETITKFGGDCEDIAIAKYMVLRLMGIPDDKLGFAYVVTQQKENHMVMIYETSAGEIMVLDNQFPEVKPAKKRPDLIAVYIFRNDGSVFLIKDKGNANRSLKTILKEKSLQKWLTAKKRYIKDTESYIPYNGGKPLAPDWVKPSK